MRDGRQRRRSSCLDQQHAMSGCADPMRQHATGRTGTDDDVIIVGPKRVMRMQRPHAGSPTRRPRNAGQCHADPRQRGTATNFAATHGLTDISQVTIHLYGLLRTVGIDSPSWQCP